MNAVYYYRIYIWCRMYIIIKKPNLCKFQKALFRVKMVRVSFVVWNLIYINTSAPNYLYFFLINKEQVLTWLLTANDRIHFLLLGFFQVRISGLHFKYLYMDIFFVLYFTVLINYQVSTSFLSPHISQRFM